MNKASCSWRVLVSAVSALVVSGCGGGRDDAGGGAEQAMASVAPPQADSAWPRYRVQELHALGEDYSAGVAFNGRLQVVGSSDTAAGERHATLLGTGAQAPLDLDAFNRPLGVPNAINNLGQVVGYRSYEQGAGRASSPPCSSRPAGRWSPCGARPGRTGAQPRPSTTRARSWATNSASRAALFRKR